MRFNTKITFYQDSQQYDPTQGKHINNPVEVFSTYANQTNTGITRSEELFGAVLTNARTIRFPEKLPKINFNYLTIGDSDTRYRTTKRIDLENSTVLITTSEVM